MIMENNLAPWQKEDFEPALE